MTLTVSSNPMEQIEQTSNALVKEMPSLKKLGKETRDLPGAVCEAWSRFASQELAYALYTLGRGELAPRAGQVRPHGHLKMCKFTQHFEDVLDLESDGYLTAYSELETRAGGRRPRSLQPLSSPVVLDASDDVRGATCHMLVVAKKGESWHKLLSDKLGKKMKSESHIYVQLSDDLGPLPGRLSALSLIPAVMNDNNMILFHLTM